MFLTNTDSTDYTDVRKAFLLIIIRKLRVIRVQIKTQITKEMFLTNTDSTDNTDVRKAFLSISIREIRGIRVQ